MKSTAVLAALIGSSTVTALEPRLMEAVSGTSEVVMTRTVTVTTFQQAEPTDGTISANRDIHSTKGHERKGSPRRRAVASPLESMSNFYGVAQEVPEPTNAAINARAPMPIVVMPTLSSDPRVGQHIAESDKQGHAVPTDHRYGTKPHNGTFKFVHVTNYTADHGNGKPHDDMTDLEDWVKKVEGTVSDKAKHMEDSALSKAKDLLNEVRSEDATPAS
ncbi:hypothetical protein N0V93_000230 [Gnomoniopsis smithogilvyi]|uniref:Uncharacterized protein n=1 Tax=Gnomoniopsis smithogilvyi TaxID=1191159 RepID=A0A9W8Z3A6_9PEZI|nr:hypothetical protein N0V93_000230 [Gnomoniopsis smithogilvyi]